MFQFTDGTTAEQIDDYERSLVDYVATLDGVESYRIGRDARINPGTFDFSIVAETAAFAAQAAAGRQRVPAQIRALLDQGLSLALWGGTGKGAAFVHHFGLEAETAPMRVVDSDAAKLNTYVPGTRYLIDSPGLLLTQPAAEAREFRSGGGPRLQAQEQHMKRPPPPQRGEPRVPRGDPDRGKSRLTDEQRRELHRDLDRANREIYRRGSR